MTAHYGSGFSVFETVHCSYNEQHMGCDAQLDGKCLGKGMLKRIAWSGVKCPEAELSGEEYVRKNCQSRVNICENCPKEPSKSGPYAGGGRLRGL